MPRFIRNTSAAAHQNAQSVSRLQKPKRRKVLMEWHPKDKDKQFIAARTGVDFIVVGQSGWGYSERVTRDKTQVHADHVQAAFDRKAAEMRAVAEAQ